MRQRRSGEMLAARELSDDLLYSWVNINRAVMCQCNDHVSQFAVQVRFLLPEVTSDPKDGREQVARVKVTFGEWMFAQALQRDRYEISQTDLLLDHHRRSSTVNSSIGLLRSAWQRCIS